MSQFKKAYEYIKRIYAEQIEIDFIKNTNVKQSTIVTFIMGFFMHLYMFTNKLPSYDDLGQLFDPINLPSSGRWFLTVPASFSSMLSIPLVNGTLGICYLSLSAGILVATLRIKSKVAAILIGGSMVSYPAVASTFAYMNCADAYFFAILLTCIAIYCADRMHLSGILVGIICIALSLGIYQAYWPFGLAIIMGVISKAILVGQEDTKGILSKTLAHLTTFGVGMVLYLFIVKISRVPLTVYQNIDTMGQITIEKLPYQLYQAYGRFVAYFTSNNLFYYPMWFRIIYTIIIVVSVILLLYKCKILVSKREFLSAIILMGCIVFFPLGANFIYIMCEPAYVHVLMRYGMVGAFILIIALWEDAECIKILQDKHVYPLTKVMKKVMVVCSILVIGIHAIIINASYLRLDISLSNGYADGIRLVTKIESVEDYNQADLILFVGTMSVNLEARYLDWFYDDMFTGMMSTDMITMGSNPEYLSRYIGFENVIQSGITSSDQLEELGITEIVDEMATYPNDGSIVKYEEGVIIVKFSELTQ